MKKHRFTLILSGVPDIDPELAHALYEAMGGDIEFEMREGVASLDVTRTARALREAILSAIQAVEKAGGGVRVIRVESETANTIAKINADLLGTPSAR
jgi:hypothetical protein